MARPEGRRRASSMARIEPSRSPMAYLRDLPARPSLLSGRGRHRQAQAQARKEGKVREFPPRLWYIFIYNMYMNYIIHTVYVNIRPPAPPPGQGAWRLYRSVLCGQVRRDAESRMPSHSLFSVSRPLPRSLRRHAESRSARAPSLPVVSISISMLICLGARAACLP